ncbi:MAG: hypothetical protein ACO3CJ_07920, partial [Burkholderiaceae bacterium]
MVQVNDEEKALFEQATAGAIRHRHERHPDAGFRPKPKPIPKQRMLDERAALEESQLSDINPETLLDSDDALSFTRNGISADTLRRLRR